VRSSWLDARNETIQLTRSTADTATPSPIPIQYRTVAKVQGQEPDLGSDSLSSDLSDSDSDTSDSDSDSSSDSDSDSDCEPPPAVLAVDSKVRDVPGADKFPGGDGATEYDPRVAQAQVLFRQLDSNRDGLVDATEIDTLARLLGTALQPHQLESVMAQIDDDADGMISFGEFEQWWLLQLSLHDRTGGAAAPTPEVESPARDLTADMTPQQIAAKTIAQVRAYDLYGPLLCSSSSWPQISVDAIYIHTCCDLWKCSI
jgi:hypothetical protein